MGSSLRATSTAPGVRGHRPCSERDGNFLQTRPTSCKPSRATLLAHLAHAAVPALGAVPPHLPNPLADDAFSADGVSAAAAAAVPPGGGRFEGDPGDAINAISAATSRRLAACRAVRREARREESVRSASARAPVTSPFRSRRYAVASATPRS